MRAFLVILLSIALFGLSLVRLPAKTVSVVVEAESYALISAPMRAVKGDDGASGNAWVELPLGCGQGWRNLGGGSVTYRIEAPSASAYYLWTRTRWRDGCTNAFFLEANDGPRIVFGNDAVFNQWHWIRSQALPFSEGMNRIVFSNHSDGTALDKVIATNDPLYLPEGLGEGMSRFYDGFAGCDADNTGSWTFVSGKWRIVRDAADGAGGVSDCLAQWNPAGGIGLAGYPIWKDYSMKVSLMFSGPATAGILFNHAEGKPEYRLLWQQSDAGARLSLERYFEGRSEILAETGDAPGGYDRWHTLGFVRADGICRGFVDDKEEISAPLPGGVLGQAGVVTIDSGGVYFDNVDIRFARQ